MITRNESVSEISIKPANELGAWDQFVSSHPRGTIFHTRGMIDAYQQTPKHRSFALGACNELGEQIAALVACEVSTISGLAQRFASRSIYYAEPIYEATGVGLEACRQLIDAHDKAMRSRTLFAEVRPMFPVPTKDQDPLIDRGYELLGYLNYELDLEQSAEELFRRLNGKCRNSIRTSLKRGTTIRISQAPMADLDRFYSILQFSHNNSQIPLVDRALFEYVFQKFDTNRFRLSFAEYDGQQIAAALFFEFNGRVVYWFAGAYRVPGIAGMACIVWDAIEFYSKLGCQVLDFAGAGWKGEDYGPGRFKSQFGATLTEYGRYRKVYAPWRMKCAEFLYNRMRRLVSSSSNSASMELAHNATE
ncbi:MAG: peptidoglycan bridge formation glycyltransferase FemA/FemB family protein [Planctomycetales bacterium]|nr:peptidoglycan bridge formation glycyltransferase FemA/FemB family protein [Planctomycetales bacterium]